MHIPVQPSASQYFSSIDSGMNDAASMMSALGSSSTGGSGRQSGQHQFQDTFPGRDWLLRAGADRRLERRSLMTPERWLWFLFFFPLTAAASSFCLPGPYAVLTKDTMPQTYKRKRSWSRAVFSNLQRKGLEKRFEIQKYVTKPDRKQLAAMLGLTDAQVGHEERETQPAALNVHNSN